MDRLLLKTAPAGQRTVDEIYAGLTRRAGYGERGVCPVDLTAVYLRLCQSQSCGKCTPCRTGLGRIVELLEKILSGDGTPGELDLIVRTASAVADSADCAVGYEAAETVLGGIEAYRKDFESHVTHGTCVAVHQPVRCRWNCPAHVDIPGYIALCGQGRYADAVRLIRKDNPFPSVCSLICEHPCEEFCRRGIIDDAVNIRAIKRAAIDRAGELPPERRAPETGKKVAVVGAGPAGLSAAYYLARMGHSVTVYEKRGKTGGMLRYGIPLYRLPDKYLDADISAILKTGVKVVQGEIGGDIVFDELRKEYDSVLVTIGAHGGKALGIPGEGCPGVLSAVQLLSDMGDGNPPDLTGKNVVVIGGGNVAMDAARTCIRLGAASVRCVYRRRLEDMTALREEVEGAAAEGVELVALKAPVRVESDGSGNVAAVVFKPQIIGDYRGGRPAPRNAALPEERVDCDTVVVAIGQAIESGYFSKCGIPLSYDMIKTELSCSVPGLPGVFAGGDCTFGPATVIRAIEAGKVSAANIDAYLGYSHQIGADVEVPRASQTRRGMRGRVTSSEREAMERRRDFDLIELPVTDEEMTQECGRCLRCDHYGPGALKNGRVFEW